MKINELSTLRFRLSNLAATCLGVLLMMVALACSGVTLARGSYAGVLKTAMLCGFLALACLAAPAIRGPRGWRIPP
jgi:hypothetical protein